MYVAQERGLHTLSVEDFKPQKSGICTQSRQLSINLLQDQNIAPKKLLQKLREVGVAEKHLPTISQLGNLKANLKKDHSEGSKHRLTNFFELKEHFKKYIISSKEQYEGLGK